MWSGERDGSGSVLTGNVCRQIGRRGAEPACVWVRRSGFRCCGSVGKEFLDGWQRCGAARGRAGRRRAMRFRRRLLHRGDGGPLARGHHSLGKRLLDGRLVRRGRLTMVALVLGMMVVVVPWQPEQERRRGRRVEHDARPKLLWGQERERASRQRRWRQTFVSEYCNTDTQHAVAFSLVKNYRKCKISLGQNYPHWCLKTAFCIKAIHVHIF